MKKYLLLIAIFATLIFSGCATAKKNWQGTLNCDNMSASDIKSEIVKILMDEGFNITQNTDDFIVATSPTDDASTQKIWNGVNTSIRWQFQISQDKNNALPTSNSINNNYKVVAVAFYDVTASGGGGTYSGAIAANSSGVTFGEETHEEHYKYWRVRRKLEKFCSNQMILINTLENVKNKDDEFRK